MSDIEDFRVKFDMSKTALAGLLVSGLAKSEEIKKLLDSLPEEVPLELAEEVARLRREFQNIRDVETALNVLVEEALLLDLNDKEAAVSFVHRWVNSGFAPSKDKAMQ